MSKIKPLPKLHSVDNVADALGVSPKTVRRWIETGDLKAHRIGRQLRISEHDYHDFVARRRTSL